MRDKRSDVLYGSLGLIILKTLEALGPPHGFRIARRIEQISGKPAGNPSMLSGIRHPVRSIPG